MMTVRAGDRPGYDANTQTEGKTMTDQTISRQVRRATPALLDVFFPSIPDNFRASMLGY